MKKLIFVFLLLLFAANYLFSQEAKITINTIKPDKNQISKLFYGNFIEFLNDFVNGDFGLWAQEIKNRGFDLVENNQLKYWTFISNSNYPNDSVSLKKGGYNPNGLFYVNISNKYSNSISGLKTKVYVYDTVGGKFYIYLKSNSTAGRVLLQLSDTLTKQIYFKEEIKNITNLWQKFNINTPPITQVHRVDLSIIMEGDGELDLDEASFMPSNNVDGVKKEYFDMFKHWRPGILRYPGGGFADTELSHWLDGVGDIDKRKSPNTTYFTELQRLDFGTDEFIKFCKAIDAEPHIVVNIGQGTDQEAVNWLSYCNSDTNTEYGKLRKINGNPEPYNVKYWEIGNEQLLNAIANKYLPFYFAMKSMDSTIECMVDGNLWEGRKFFDDVYDIIGLNNQYYSYHTVTGATATPPYKDEDLYSTIVAFTTIFENDINLYRDWLKDRNLYGKVNLAITELFIDYWIKPGWIDTNWRNSTLETGLWMAGSMNAFLRSCDVLKIVEKTFGLDHIRGGFNKKGERIIYPTPIHTVLDFYRNHNGKFYLHAITKCPKYAMVYVNGLWTLDSIPVLDVLVTGEDKFIYLNVLNRDYNNSVNTNLDFPFKFLNKKCQIFELNGNILDLNEPDYPNKVDFKESSIEIGKNYVFPPHSFTSIKIPIDFDLSKGIDSVISNNIIIFPNPASDFITIGFDSSFDIKNYSIQIYDYIGNLINSYDGTENFKRIDVSNYSLGIYFIKTKDSNGNIRIISFIKS